MNPSEAASAERDHAEEWWLAHVRRHGCTPGDTCPVRTAIVRVMLELRTLENVSEGNNTPERGVILPPEGSDQNEGLPELRGNR